LSLKKAAFRGLFWVGIEKVGLHLIQISVFIILARLLVPEDFGLIGMIMILFSVSSTIMEGGVSQALIREKTIEQDDINTAFLFNVLFGIILYILLYVTAPYISHFYNDERLTLLVRIMGLSVLFQSFGLVFSASLVQKMNFKRELILILPAHLISGLTAITMGYSGYGVISIAMKFVILELIKSFTLFYLSQQKIHLGFSKSSFKKLFSFGMHLTGSKLISSMHSNLYKVLIGKFFSASTLGLYTQAQKIMRLLSSNILQAIQKVTYPSLSKIKGNKVRLKSGYRKIIQLSMLLIMPLMALLIVIADPLIPFLLGEQWAGAVPMLQIISVGGMVFYLILIYQNLLKVIGRTDIYLKLEIIQKVNITIALAVGIWFNILIFISLVVVSHFITTFIYAYKVGKFVDYSISEQIKDIADIFVVSLLVLGIIYYFKLIMMQYNLHSLVLLTILSISVMSLFIAIGFIIKSPKIKLLKDTLL